MDLTWMMEGSGRRIWLVLASQRLRLKTYYSHVYCKLVICLALVLGKDLALNYDIQTR